MRDVQIAFCVDRHALTGLHITLASALHHFSSDRTLLIHLVHHGLSAADLEALGRTIDRAARTVDLRPISFRPALFGDLRSFVGGQMTYARLVLPELIDVSKAIYLDADLIVGVDLAELYDLNLGGAAVGAVTWASRADEHDRRLFETLGRDMALPYFNAGVLLLDLEKWRREGLTRHLLETGMQLRDLLLSHDQSLINLCLEGDIQPLPQKFNTPVTPRRRPLPPDVVQDRVIHLVARPKPWDPLGRLNGQYIHYMSYLPSTDIAGSGRGTLSRFAAFRRVLRSPWAYAKCLRRQ